MKNTIKGGKSDNMSLQDIAKKFKVSVDKIQAQLQKGIKIESEHTDDKEKAKEIAMDHITEFPDYYDRLEKMEKDAEKDLKETQKILIKKLLREEIEEGNFAKTLGTLGMAAATLGSPNAKAMTKDPVGIEKSYKIGITKNTDGTYISKAKTDGPTKEMAKNLAINKAKVQIANALNLEISDLEFDVLPNELYEKGKNNIICTVQILVTVIK
jgi:hypothetical protein